MPTKIQEKEDTNPDMWKARDVSKFLKISMKSVYIQARAGEIPCKIIGGTIFRFDRKKVVALI